MLPDVPALVKKFDAKELSIVLFNSEKSPKSVKEIKAFYQKKKINIPVFSVVREPLAKHCALKFLPGMWITDNNGKIVSITVNNFDDVISIIFGKLGKKVDDETKKRAKKPVQT